MGQIACQLVGIFIAGNQKRPIAKLLVARGNRAQDIVALPTGKRHHGNVHRGKQVLDYGELRLQLFVHRWALRLVLLKRLHAELRAALIERAHQRIGLLHLDEFQQHGKEAECRIGGGAIGSRHSGRHCMVGTMHQRVSVDNGNGFRHEVSSLI